MGDALSADMPVRVVLDSERRRYASRVGHIEYLGDTHARVRFDSDDEFTYWFRRSDLVPALRQDGGSNG